MDYSDGMNLITQVSAANNAWSAEQAQKQMAFEERMSNTAHQREVADLKAAGLNPVLSAHGAGATTPTGAMGGTDTNLTSALYGLVKDAINSQMISAKAVASVAKSASGSGSGKSSQSGDAEAVKNAILGAFTNSNSGVKQIVEKAKFEQDREAKRKDAQASSTENAKLFGIPLGPLANAIAQKVGYDNWAEMAADDLLTAATSNREVGKSLNEGLASAKNSSKDLAKDKTIAVSATDTGSGVRKKSVSTGTSKSKNKSNSAKSTSAKSNIKKNPAITSSVKKVVSSPVKKAVSSPVKKAVTSSAKKVKRMVK